MKEFDEWNEIKKKVNSKDNNIILKEGGVYWCKFGMNVGDEARGKGSYFKRPVLVLKKFTRNVFFGIPLTSREKHGTWYYKITHKDKINYLILNQLKLIDKKRLEKKIYQISEKELYLIKLALNSLLFT